MICPSSITLRSLGAYNNVIVNEGLVDEVANKVGEDPIAIELSIVQTNDRKIYWRLEAESRKYIKFKEGQGWGVGYTRYKTFHSRCTSDCNRDEEVTVDGLFRFRCR